jgi:hypothetical protein
LRSRTIRLMHEYGLHARRAFVGLGLILIWRRKSCIGARCSCFGHIRALVFVYSGTILARSGALEHSFRDHQLPNTRNIINSIQLIDGGLGEICSWDRREESMGGT